jgi:hypothetical protein
MLECALSQYMPVVRTFPDEWPSRLLDAFLHVALK